MSDPWALTPERFERDYFPDGGATPELAVQNAAAFRRARSTARQAESDARKARQAAAQVEANRKYAERVARVDGVLANYNTGRTHDCGYTREVLSNIRHRSQALTDWDRAMNMDRVIACTRIPVSLIAAARAAPASAYGNTAPQRGFWEQFNERLDQVPTTLKCTKDYATKTETCKWIE